MISKIVVDHAAISFNLHHCHLPMQHHFCSLIRVQLPNILSHTVHTHIMQYVVRMRYSFDLGKHSYDRKMFFTLSGRVKTQCVKNLVESVKFGQSWSTKLVSGILFTQKLLNLKFKIVNLNSKSQEANSLN